MTRRRIGGVACAAPLLLLCCAARSPAARAVTEAPRRVERAPETLAFERVAGDVHNYFFRRGPVAAHVLLRSSTSPRIVVAFPAGNTGAGLWFEPTAEPLAMALEGSLEPVEGAMRGVRGAVRFDATRLALRTSVLGSLRFVRQETTNQHAVEGTTQAAPTAEHGVRLARTMLDGHRVSVQLDPLDGATVAIGAAGVVQLAAAPGAPSIRVRFTALCDEPPLTPIESDALLTGPVPDREALETLAFLAYREKLLAGSWRFLTYFGRDTLMSIELLMPALRAEVIEAGLGAVLDRVAADGDVAHEEDVGELAAWDATHAPAPSTDRNAPRFDYKMVDDDFMLAPVAAHYLLDTPAGRARAAAFLARRTPSGVPYAAALQQNLQRVVRLATPFANHASPATLIAIRPDISVGEWRDSEAGLGGGRIPFDVNAVLVPAALAATRRLGADALRAQAAQLEVGWQRAAALFRVVVPQAQAIARVRAYAAEQGIDDAPAVASIRADVDFPALALDASGRPVPVMHSDEGFELLLGAPTSTGLLEIATRITRPFPAGLLTPVGLVVADPAFAPDAATRALFTRAAYHGTVVWSWQQAMLAAGLARQLARADLTAAARSALTAAQSALWRAIDATRATRSAELWSFAIAHGDWRVEPYGASDHDADEANAAQLWSTVYLAIRAPAADAPH